MTNEPHRHLGPLMRLPLSMATCAAATRVIHVGLVRSRSAWMAPILLGLLVVGMTQCPDTGRGSIRVDRSEAQRLWETSVRAKGGRERLHSVETILVRGGSSQRDVRLIAFPDRYWRWSDSRPSPVGLTVTMFNLSLGKSYFSVLNDEGSPRQLLDLENDKVILMEEQLTFLLETRWSRPVPVDVLQTQVDGRQCPVVVIEIQGHLMGVALDVKSRLPRAILMYPDGDIEQQPFTFVRLKDYRIIDGILLPTKVAFTGTSYLKIECTLNVKHSLHLFETPPSIQAGPDAWRE